MGVSYSVDEFAAKLSSAAGGFGRASDIATLAAAQTVKDAVLPLMAAATGGDMRISGMRNARIGVTYTNMARMTDGVALVRAFGPAHIVERDVKPHPILPRKAGRNRQVRSQAPAAAAMLELLASFGGGGQVESLSTRGTLRFADGSYRRYAMHGGGSKGRHPWELGVEAAKPAVRVAFDRAYAAEMAKVFGAG